MGLIRRLLRPPMRQVPERIVQRVLRESTALGGIGSQLPQGYDNGIHLDFVNDFHYIKVPGNDPVIAPLTTLFTFTGGNQSMYRGANGLLRASATNTPRIEYDASGNLLGLLIEGARTNIGLHSDDGTNAAWVKSNTTAAKTSIGPDGVANSATRVTATAGNGTILQTVTSGSATRAYSVWLKRITGTGNIDLTVDNGATWTTKTITSSWARYDISQAAVTNPVFGIRIVTSGDAVDFYGNQLESAAFPSSLIPTTTGSVARTADKATRTHGAEFSSSSGTLFINYDQLGQEGGNDYFITHGNVNGALFFTNALKGRTADGTNTTITANAGTANVMSKFAMAYDVASGTALILNTGSIVTASFDGDMNSAGTTFNINGISADGLGHIRRLDYWPERKINSELQRLTT